MDQPIQLTSSVPAGLTAGPPLESSPVNPANPSTASSVPAGLTAGPPLPDTGASTDDSSSKSGVLSTLGDVGTGFAKGAEDTVSGVSSAIHHLPYGIGEKLVPPEGLTAMKEQAKPTNTAQAIGYGGETLAEIMLSDGALSGLSMAEKTLAVGRTLKVLEKSPKLMEMLKSGATISKATASLSPEERAVIAKYPTIGKLISSAMSSARAGTLMGVQTLDRTGDPKEALKSAATGTLVGTTAGALGEGLSAYGGWIKDALSPELKATKSTSDLSKTILAAHEANGGSTFTKEGKDLVGTPNYSVSLFPDLGKVHDGAVTADHIKDFIQKPEVKSALDKGAVIGTWLDKDSGKTYLDVSAVTPDKEKAIELGKKYNQKAVFDLKNMQEVPTGGTGEAVGKLPSVEDRMNEVNPASAASKLGSKVADQVKEQALDQAVPDGNDENKPLNAVSPSTVKVNGVDLPVSSTQLANRTKTQKVIGYFANDAGQDNFIHTHVEPAAAKAIPAGFTDSASQDIQAARVIRGETGTAPAFKTVDDAVNGLKNEAQVTYKKLDDVAMNDPEYKDIQANIEHIKNNPPDTTDLDHSIGDVENSLKGNIAPEDKVLAKEDLKNLTTQKKEMLNGQKEKLNALQQQSEDWLDKNQFTRLQDKVQNAKDVLSSKLASQTDKLQAKKNLPIYQQDMSDFLDKNGDVVSQGEKKAADVLWAKSQRYGYVNKTLRSAIKTTNSGVLDNGQPSISVGSLKSLPSKFDNKYGEGAFNELIGPQVRQNYDTVLRALDNPLVHRKNFEELLSGAGVLVGAGHGGLLMNAGKAMSAPTSYLANKILFDPVAGQKFVNYVNGLKSASGTSAQLAGRVIQKTAPAMAVGADAVRRGILSGTAGNLAGPTNQ